MNIKPRHKALLLALALLPAITQVGCQKKLKKIAGFDWDPTLVTPIGYGDFGVYDILAATDSSNLIIINPLDGEIALSYTGELASFDASSIVALNDYHQQFDLAGGLGLVSTTAFNGTVSHSFTQNVAFPTTNGVELHTVNFESGMITLDVSTTLKQDVTLAVHFLDLKKNGVIISKTIQLDYSGTIPQSKTVTLDLTDATADFTSNGTGVNKLLIGIDATITGTGQPVTGSESLTVDMDLQNLEFKNVIGYFGQQPLVNASDSILIKLFNKNSTTGTFALTNPSITFVVDNSFGIPVQLHFNQLKTINVEDGQQFSLTGFPTTLNINTPAALGQTATTSLHLDKTNTTNITTIISPTPKYLEYDISGSTNPNGQTGPLNFVASDSKLVVRTELLLPLEGYSYGLTLGDTMPFNFDADVNNVESAMFRINVVNGFPVTFKANAIFTDEYYVPLFSLLDTGEITLIEAAAVDGTGRVTTTNSKITDITLTDAKIKLLGQAKHVIITGGAETTKPQGTIVKFFDNYKMSLKLGMQIKLHVPL